MKPDYLRLNEVAELLKCEPHHVKDLLVEAKLRCGVMARGWWGHALPADRRWRRLTGGVADFGPDGEHDKTFSYRDLETGQSFRVRSAYVAQFWYLTHSTAYEFFTSAAAEVLEDFLLEPEDGETLHKEHPDRFPWPEFSFWPFRDQDPPPRVTWQDILFLRRDVEALTVNTMGDAERDRLLKTIGALALALSEKGGRYQKGSQPNAARIAEFVSEIVAALPDAQSRGLGMSNVRGSIAEGLRLLDK